MAATEAAAEAAVVVAVEAEAPPTYGISASVTYVAGLWAMAAALVDAIEDRQSGENEGREEEQEAAWAERRVFVRRQGGLTGAGCQCQCGGYWGHWQLPGCKVSGNSEAAQQGSEDSRGRRSKRS